MPNLALSQAAGSPPAAEPHFEGNGELRAEPGSSLPGLKPPLRSFPGVSRLGAAFSGISESSPEPGFAFPLVPAAQGDFLGRQGGFPTWRCRHNPQTSCSSLGNTLSSNQTNLRGTEHSLHAFESFSLPFFLFYLFFFAIPLILFQLPQAVKQILGLSSMSARQG